ncbi:Helicase associated domain protein [Streptomyces uncialis]|uniref:DEAD/DEAH box helicase n=1 Tax=Streptomyces uncialis TaxID=1048205 RepID=UPI00386F7ED1|nr:Helicase associated domain protein [Streptomyces uncialis]WTE15356.1 Helicase associated domain protein [Streptomyces uncialis]
MAGVKLREHQVDANTRIRKWVGFPARSSVTEHGARAMVVSATGSGKTITVAAAAHDYFRSGRILVMVPTLDLLVQTAEAWHRVGHQAPMVAVCSLEGDAVLKGLGVRSTTNAIQLALWAGSGPVIVLATYASLVDREDPADPTEQNEQKRIRGPLEAALAGGERLYGQQMDGFDLAVVDEAHGTAGDMGRAWAAIHDNRRIPADFRLYLTATPRILAAPRPQKGKDGRELEIASMSEDSQTYGERIVDLGLSEAIERQILAGFEIDVLEIRDPDPILGISEEALRGRRLALLQTALLEHAAAKNLRTVMTFHQRVEEAEAFAEKLPQTAAELYRTEASDKALKDAEALPKSSIDAELYELEAGRHVPPDRVWAAWLCGDHLVSERREVIRQFANGINAANKRVHRAFLASVRVLGEGVDIVGERGVEAICFADTRGSQVEIVQNIGRALRPNPDGTTKVARIIVPIFLERDEDPGGMIASASYKPLVAVLNGLRSHDERLVEQLASRTLSCGKQDKRTHVKRDEDGQIIRTGENEDQEQEENGTEGAVESALLHFSGPRDPATIAAFLRTRVYRPESLVWLEGFEARRRWRFENGITGLVATPYDTEVPVGVVNYPLGRWEAEQRRAARTGDLEERRRVLLNEEGMVWEPGDEAWETKLAFFRSFHRAHGHLAPRQDAFWGETEAEAQPVGQHMANLRRKGGLGKDTERAEKRAAQMTAIDPDWNCPWPLDWQRHYTILRDLAAEEPGGALPHIEPGVLFEGDDLGAWIQRQQKPAAWKLLTDEQRERLTGLCIAPVEKPAPVPAGKNTESGVEKLSAPFQRGITAWAQYIAREGKTTVPRPHTEPVIIDSEEHTVKLGAFATNTKQRLERLTHHQRTVLRQAGVEWA